MICFALPWQITEKYWSITIMSTTKYYKHEIINKGTYEMKFSTKTSWATSWTNLNGLLHFEEWAEMVGNESSLLAFVQEWTDELMGTYTPTCWLIVELM